MKTKESTIIILESKEEKDLLSHIMHFFYKNSQEGGMGGTWSEIYKVFQKVSGSRTLQEYEEKRDAELKALFPTKEKS